VTADVSTRVHCRLAQRWPMIPRCERKPALSDRRCSSTTARSRSSTHRAKGSSPRGTRSATVFCATARALTHLVRIVGPPVGDVAEQCQAGNFPPLSAPAVGETGLPVQGYDGAGGFKGSNWVEDVEKCIRFAGYPATML
jgi:hypothetical protein